MLGEVVTIPLIIVKKKPQLSLPRKYRKLQIKCSKCGQIWRYSAGGLDVVKIEDMVSDNRARAISLLMMYLDKGIGPCCFKPEDRAFIAKNARFVTYERID